MIVFFDKARRIEEHEVMPRQGETLIQRTKMVHIPTSNCSGSSNVDSQAAKSHVKFEPK